MSFEIIDPVIFEWGRRINYPVDTEYKDFEVRSVEMVSPDCRRFQIWIDPPDPSGSTMVHLWDYKKRSIEKRADVNSLAAALDELTAECQNWMLETHHLS